MMTTSNKNRGKWASPGRSYGNMVGVKLCLKFALAVESSSSSLLVPLLKWVFPKTCPETEPDLKLLLLETLWPCGGQLG